MTNEQRMGKLADRIEKQAEAGMGRGLNAARAFVTGRVKEAVSMPAPRKPVRAKTTDGSKGGILHYRATARALAGAPPRKLSSRMRTSIGSKMLGADRAVLGVKARANPTKKYPAGYNYPEHHEVEMPGVPSSGQHQFLKPTVRKYKREITDIVGRNVAMTVR